MRAAAGLLALLGALGPGTAAADESWPGDNDGWGDSAGLPGDNARPAIAQRTLPLRFSERPLTVPRDVFDVYFGGDLTVNPDNQALAGLRAGARYGVTKDLEAGIEIIRVVLSEALDSGLDRPTAFTIFRFAEGVFEPALRFETELPVGSGGLDMWLSAPMLLRLGGHVRLDVRPTIQTTAQAPWPWLASGPAEVTVQVTDRLRIAGRVELVAPNLRTADDLLLRAGGSVAYAFGDKMATWELVGTVVSPFVELVGENPRTTLSADTVQGFVTLRLFFAGPAEDRWSSLF